LRGNGGGILGSMIGLGGMLTEKSIDLGTSIYRFNSENMVAASKAKNFKGRIVVLVDNQTASAAEIFAAALQENNRALIVGEKTAGEALPSVSVELPTGALMFYPIANFKTRNGNYLEGKGIEPDFVVPTDRKSLLSEKDAPLEAALKIIKENSAFPKSVEGIISINTTAPPPPAPPAPKPIAPIGKTLAEVTVKAAPQSPMPVVKRDEKALQIIADFVAAIGGENALTKINSYKLKGISGFSGRGTKVGVTVNISRQMPDKYSEILKSEATGEIRQIYYGKNYLLQADYGIKRELPIEINTAEIEVFAPINNLAKKDFFKSLNYQGAFDRIGKQAHVIEAVTKENVKIWLAFEVESKMLVSYTSESFSVFYDDYRRVETVSLPFRITKEPYMDIKLDEIKLNAPIEAGNFTAKENCFDKPN
jgi:hypothetical protein